MPVIQFQLPWNESPALRPQSSASGRRVVDVAGRRWPVQITRHRRARRYVLRMTPDLALRLTVPRGASIDAGLRFVESQALWVGREWARRSSRDQPWLTGFRVWFRGDLVPIEATDTEVRLGDLKWARPDGFTVRAAVERGLRALATVELPLRCVSLAATTGDTVARVSVRSQRSRWGSCSTRGTIALNWRLIQMPPEVSDYVILHELMHLRQPNHSRAFWREVTSVCPNWREAERWLRGHGKELM